LTRQPGRFTNGLGLRNRCAWGMFAAVTGWGTGMKKLMFAGVFAALLIGVVVLGARVADLYEIAWAANLPG
jgi:hypothetical protein